MVSEESKSWISTNPTLSGSANKILINIIFKPPNQTRDWEEAIILFFSSNVERTRSSDTERDTVRGCSVQAILDSSWTKGHRHPRLPNQTCLVSFHSRLRHRWLCPSRLRHPRTHLQDILSLCFREFVSFNISAVVLFTL